MKRISFVSKTVTDALSILSVEKKQIHFYRFSKVNYLLITDVAILKQRPH